ncbi:LuxR C-terminal-related transcriptional regulator [Streptomyces sp. NPDC018019]|uniref:LuxR C-terminal-related transcriptional regulator n=1 Tax=Streptomyces sp. NPDC018019 TaxID=3365030 RepID=UPI0037AE60E3
MTLLCRKGLHDLDDPAVARTAACPCGCARRYCLLCRTAAERERRARAREVRRGPVQLEWTGPRRLSRSGRYQRRRGRGAPLGLRTGRLAYRITPQERQVLQLLADGLSGSEIAERLWLARLTVRDRLMKNIRLKYGVASNAAAVAQGLKRGAVRPDPAGRRLPRTKAVRDGARSVIRLVKGERRPRHDRSRALQAMLDGLYAWSEAHAVSLLWSAGHITSRHVPQTRNAYRGEGVRTRAAKEAA